MRLGFSRGAVHGFGNDLRREHVHGYVAHGLLYIVAHAFDIFLVLGGGLLGGHGHLRALLGEIGAGVGGLGRFLRRPCAAGRIVGILLGHVGSGFRPLCGRFRARLGRFRPPGRIQGVVAVTFQPLGGRFRPLRADAGLGGGIGRSGGGTSGLLGRAFGTLGQGQKILFKLPAHFPQVVQSTVTRVFHRMHGVLFRVSDDLKGLGTRG